MLDIEYLRMRKTRSQRGRRVVASMALALALDGKPNSATHCSMTSASFSEFYYSPR